MMRGLANVDVRTFIRRLTGRGSWTRMVILRHLSCWLVTRGVHDGLQTQKAKNGCTAGRAAPLLVDFQKPALLDARGEFPGHLCVALEAERRGGSVWGCLTVSGPAGRG